MSTDNANSSVSTGQFDAIMRRIDELESTVEQQAERIDELESLVEIRSEEQPGLKDIWINNQPVGMLLDKANNRSKDNEKAIENGVVTETDGGTEALAPEVRDRMLPIHKMWVSVRDGEDGPLGASDTRAAHLFGRFIRRAAGEPESSVDASGKLYYKMSSSDASDVLAEAEEMPTSGKSMVVKRAMRQVETYTVIEEGDEPLIEFRKEHGKNLLAVKKTKFNAVMKNVETAIKGSVDVDSDDSGNSDEVDRDLEHANKRMSQLTDGGR